MRTNLVALCIKKPEELAQLSTYNMSHLQVVDILINNVNAKADVPWDNVLPVKCNLNSDRLHDILRTLGIDTKKYEARYAFIDEKLLDLRNAVAHGELREIDDATLSDVSEFVLRTIEWFKDDVMTGATYQLYKAVL